MGWFIEDRLVLTVHSEQPPTEAEWAANVASLERFAGPHEIRALIVSDGGGPSGLQREALVEVLERKSPHGFRTAIVTRSLAVRGIGVALSWFLPGYRFFRPNRLDDALDHLVLKDAEVALARTELERLQVDLGVARRAAG